MLSVELSTRMTADASLAKTAVDAENTKGSRVVIRDCIENRADGWWFVVFSEERDIQKPVGEYGPYARTSWAEEVQVRYYRSLV